MPDKQPTRLDSERATPAGKPVPVAPGTLHSTPAPRTLHSEDILAGQREVYILHHGEIYRLRVTRRGKLILQK
ncbi:MAG: hemin uptake protein HemP [Gemmataceae bacterium]|nr:hemin uptake protein HemP [Gemmataceae bacterium]MCS7270781.1 hemin uptake protein HemP [Gemmataceae bacterium]MDW8242175.1 hemin uptake protein HemP [Thermogemmata sp.]